MRQQLILCTVLLVFAAFPGFATAESEHTGHPTGHPATDTTVVESPPQDEDGAILIGIKDFKYLPAHFKVKVGAKVRWVNQEKRQYHNVWFEQLGEPEPPYLFPGDQYERTFDTAGSFPYRCGPHPEMTGAVVVE